MKQARAATIHLHPLVGKAAVGAAGFGHTGTRCAVAAGTCMVLEKILAQLRAARPTGNSSHQTRERFTVSLAWMAGGVDAVLAEVEDNGYAVGVDRAAGHYLGPVASPGLPASPALTKPRPASHTSSSC